MNTSRWLAAGAVAMLMLACSSQKDPAEQAIQRMDNTIDQVRDAATKYAPDSLKAVETQVHGVKDSFAKGDYAGVLAATPAVNSAILAMKKDALEKQSAADSELAKVKQEWRNLTSEVPKLVQGLHTQLDTLSSGHGLPKGVTKASLATAKDGVASLDTLWTDATNAVSTGDYATAVTKGQAVKDKATELMHTLGMKQS